MIKNTIIWIFGFVVAIASGVGAIGAIAKNKAPELAVTLSPMNGFAAENLAAAAIKKSVAENLGQFPNRIAFPTITLAQAAFIAEPATPEAVAVLALTKEDIIKQKLMSRAYLLSRRQPLVTGWMIADSGAREDVPALLDYYDTMLRTNTSAASVVIPVMAGALADDNFVAPFASLLSKQPPWANQFWGTVVGTPRAVVNAARLREALYKPGENNEVYRDADLIRALVNNQQFDRAVNLYKYIVNSKKIDSVIKNGTFDADSKYAPIDWQLFSTGKYSATITKGKLELSAIRSAGGLLARQLVRLPAGTLKLEVIPNAAIAEDAQIFITLTCAEKMTKIPQPIRIPLKGKIANLQVNNSQSGCGFYWLDFSGRASENGDGFDIVLDSISLR